MVAGINNAPLIDLSEVGGLLVTTLEDAYNAVRKEFPEVPPAVLVISSQPPSATKQVWGHFAHSRWDVQGVKLPEIMISAEGLRREPREVLATLVHEAAHGLCFVRKIHDTSNSGRYHNDSFRIAAEELGLVTEKVKFFGFAKTILPEGKYESILRDITPDLVAYRDSDITVTRAGSTGSREAPFRCSCSRTIRMYENVYNAGPILCGVCGDEFI